MISALLPNRKIGHILLLESDFLKRFSNLILNIPLEAGNVWTDSSNSRSSTTYTLPVNKLNHKSSTYSYGRQITMYRHVGA
jgi:hypothetical protein